MTGYTGQKPLEDRLNDIERNYQLRANTPYGPIPTFDKAGLPDAAFWLRCLIYVSDATSGNKLAISDGTAWLEDTTGSAVV